MELNSYAVFLIAAEEMSFTNAAKRLYMTQQGLSAHIRRLEDHYHVRLFERRPVLKLTPEGESMVFYARQILDSERLMTSQFADLTPESFDQRLALVERTRTGVFLRFRTDHNG